MTGRRWASTVALSSASVDLEQRILQYVEEHRDRVIDGYGLAGLIQACSRSGSPRAGKEIEAEISRRGFRGNKSVGNHLINMYGRLGCVHEAAAAFDAIEEKNVVSFNALITAYTQNGHWREGLALVRKLLQLDSTMVNMVTFVSTIKSCCSNPRATLEECRWIHKLVYAAGLSSWNVVVGTALINMYASCGSLLDAEAVFDSMENRNEITWSSLIAAHAAVSGHAPVVWDIFRDMEDSGVPPNDVTFITMASSCTVPEDLEIGRMIREAAEKHGYGSDIVVSNALLNMFGKCEDLEQARQLFDEMPHKYSSSIAWNSLMGAYTQTRNFVLALEIFGLMQLEGVKANKVTFLAALNACAGMADMKAGKMLVDCVVEFGLFEDDLVKTAVLSLFGKCGYLDAAEELLSEIDAPDLVSWASIVAAYTSQPGHDHDVIRAFRLMHSNGLTADEGVFVAALNSCANLGALNQGKLVHYLIRETGVTSNDIFTALANMYGKCGELLAAAEIFNSIPDRFRDALTWNTMINVFTQQGRPNEALSFYWRMHQDGTRPKKTIFVTVLNAVAALGSSVEGRRINEQVLEYGLEPDSAVGTALLNMYTKSGSVDAAREIFDQMQHKNIVTWNSMLGACVLEQQKQQDDDEDKNILVAKFFAGMLLEGIKVDRVTMITMLSACSTLLYGKKLHSLVHELNLEMDTGLSNALVIMYSRCGSLEVARAMFEKMSSMANLITWNSIIAACAQHGHASDAVELVRRMEQAGSSPDYITLTVVLSACSHAGLVDNAYEFFHLMLADDGIEPVLDHYGTIVDLLCRAGKLAEAESLIRKLPVAVGTVPWMSLLGRCQSYGDVARGRRAADQLLEIDPERHTTYVMLSNTCRGSRE